VIEPSAGAASTRPASAPTLSAAVRALTRSARLLERSLTDLSMADFRLLSAVAEGEARASRLAARLAIGKPTVSSTVDSLVRRGLLERESHDGDQRVVRLALTAEGERMRRSAERDLEAVVARLAAEADDGAGVITALAALDVAIERVHVASADARRATADAGMSTASSGVPA
jgi:DNA-binding MarR family transcriptional regulator